MKALLLALVTTLLIGGLIFVVCLHTGVGEKVAGPFAGSALTFFTFIHDKTEKILSSRGVSKVTPGIAPMSGFELHPGLMLLYTFLTLLGALELVSGLSGVVAALTAPTPNTALITMGLVQLPFTLLFCYLVARWCGIRGGNSAYWIFPVALILFRVSDGLMLVFSSRSGDLMRSSYLAMLRTNKLAVVAFLIFLIAIGEFGVFRGTKVRFGAYFTSLLKQIPEGAREALLSMAYEEAKVNAKPGAAVAVTPAQP